MNPLSAFADWMGWEKLSTTKERHKQIMAKLNELASVIASNTAQLTKALSEIRSKVDAQAQKIQELTDAINNAEVPQDVTDALAALQTATQALDDVVPDAPPQT